ncbi:hypothetical protein [Enterobacter mori]|uniref:hypothetical protein n=1 Tax=Enterobacter mori TaxID=539813 RepID=UPI003B844C37
MKWDKVALVVLEENMDDATLSLAEEMEYYINRYNIPSHLVVTINQPVREFIYGLGGIGREIARWRGVLAGLLTSKSKIFIIAHGSRPPTVTCARLDGVLMSRLLKILGVTEAGLISFKSCHTGRDSYLEEFAAACTHDNIRFGWCLGYINYAGLCWKGLITGSTGYHKRQLVGIADSLLYHMSCGLGKLPDSYRVRIVEGTLTLPEEFVKTLGPRFNR